MPPIGSDDHVDFMKPHFAGEHVCCARCVPPKTLFSSSLKRLMGRDSPCTCQFRQAFVEDDASRSRATVCHGCFHWPVNARNFLRYMGSANLSKNKVSTKGILLASFSLFVQGSQSCLMLPPLLAPVLQWRAPTHTFRTTVARVLLGIDVFACCSRMRSSPFAALVAPSSVIGPARQAG